MTDETLRALSEVATPGLWEAAISGAQCEDIIAGDYSDATHVVCLGHDYEDYGEVSAADGRFIAAAVNYVRATLASPPTAPTLDVERLARAIETWVRKPGNYIDIDKIALDIDPDLVPLAAELVAEYARLAGDPEP